jgi:arylformamidase
MRVYDITVEINPELPIWPGDPEVKIERFEKLETGDNANISRMEMGLHTGTHVDAPYHFLAGGITLDKIPLERFIGTASVVEVPVDVSILSSEVLARLPADRITERLKPEIRSIGQSDRIVSTRISSPSIHPARSS